MHKRNAILHFGPELVDKPVLSGMIRGHQVEINLLQASIEPDVDGTAFIQITGQRAEVERALGYLRQRGVRLIFPAKNLIYDEQRCIHCGACVAQCLVQALHVEPGSGRVLFDHDKCLACELCIPACPYRALESVSEHLGTAAG